MNAGEGRVRTYLWSEGLAAVCVVAWSRLVRSDCTEIGCFEISCLNFSRSSCSSCVSRSTHSLLKAVAVSRC